MMTLSARQIRAAYDGRTVIDDLSLEIPAGRITAIVGPNACGKSTLLRSLARLLRPRAGRVLLDGHDIHRVPTREVARRVGILPQSAEAPAGLSVIELVSRGRHPHQSLLRQWSPRDDRAVATAMAAARIGDLARRSVDSLSGGQRQRVWVAMVLAQETDILLLDEPTTFLDLPHQVELLELVLDLNRERARTVVMVLHDLNQACRYAHHLVAMRQGQIVAQGPPEDTLTAELVRRLFGIEVRVIADPVVGSPLVVAVGGGRRALPPAAEAPA